MILPNKHVKASAALLGIGAMVLERLTAPMTVSRLWDELRGVPGVPTFDRFVLALAFLYSVGAIDLEAGLIRRNQR